MNTTSNSVHDRLAALSAAGVSVWLDDLSRELLRTGQLATLVADGDIVGITTNPTIFASAMANGEAYDAQVRELAAAGASVTDAVRALTVADVAQACDILRPVWEATDGVDGRVSLEVDPGLSRDPDATVEQAVELWKAVDRPNLMVKIPATEVGLPAVTRVLSEGISVNVTLIFSVERYRAVVDAYLEGLEQAADRGHKLNRIVSVASFFVSRVDTEIDARLDAIGTAEALALRGQAAVANCRLAYAASEELFTGPRWDGLAAQGARPQRPLWASTGMKDPARPDTHYVSELVVANTVNTMPLKTVRAFADHGEVNGDRVTATAGDAQRVFDDLQRLGLDITDVFLTLEDQGVAKFEASWSELAATVQAQLDQAR